MSLANSSGRILFTSMTVQLAYKGAFGRTHAINSAVKSSPATFVTIQGPRPFAYRTLDEPPQGALMSGLRRSTGDLPMQWG